MKPHITSNKTISIASAMKNGIKMQCKDPQTLQVQTKTPTQWDICLHEVQTRMSWTLERNMKVFRLLGKISAWREIIKEKMVKMYRIILICSLLLETWLSSEGKLTFICLNPSSLCTFLQIIAFNTHCFRLKHWTVEILRLSWSI